LNSSSVISFSLRRAPRRATSASAAMSSI
jgi:hypothetical protein